MHLLKGRKMSELTNSSTPTLGSSPTRTERTVPPTSMGREESLTQTRTPDAIPFPVVTVTVPGCCTFQQHKPLSTYSAVGSVLLGGQAVIFTKQQHRKTAPGPSWKSLHPSSSYLHFSLLEGYRRTPVSVLSVYGQPLGCISVSFFSHQI